MFLPWMICPKTYFFHIRTSLSHAALAGEEVLTCSAPGFISSLGKVKHCSLLGRRTKGQETVRALVKTFHTYRPSAGYLQCSPSTLSSLVRFLFLCFVLSKVSGGHLV